MYGTMLMRISIRMDAPMSVKKTESAGFEPARPEKGKPIYSQLRSTLLRQLSAWDAAVGD